MTPSARARRPKAAVVPRSCLFEPRVHDEVEAYQMAHGLSSFSKALMAMLAERLDMLAQGRTPG